MGGGEVSEYTPIAKAKGGTAMSEIPVGPELDRAVAEGVMGFMPLVDERGDWCLVEPHVISACRVVPPYCSDIAAAWQVVEKVLERDARMQMGYSTWDYQALPWMCTFYSQKDIGSGRGVSASEAICRAALGAVK